MHHYEAGDGGGGAAAKAACSRATISGSKLCIKELNCSEKSRLALPTNS